MAQFNFTFNGIDTTVDTTTRTIKFSDLSLPTLTRVYQIPSFSGLLNKELIGVESNTYLEDSQGNEIPGTRTSRPYRTTTNLEYQFFYSLIPVGISIGEVSVRACINNQLENMQDVYGESITCFSALNSFAYFNPIDISTLFTAETELTNDATITVTVENPIDANVYRYSLDNITYQESNVFNNLTNGVYTVYVKNITESLASGFDIIKSKTTSVNNE